MTIRITSQISIPDDEIVISAIRSRGPGGQNVNKASTAVQLRFDVAASSLPEEWKGRLLELSDRRITGDGIIVITAMEHRSQARNRQAALARLEKLVARATRPPKTRLPTKPTEAARRRRLDEKRRRGKIKTLRSPVDD